MGLHLHGAGGLSGEASFLPPMHSKKVGRVLRWLQAVASVGLYGLWPQIFFMGLEMVISPLLSFSFFFLPLIAGAIDYFFLFLRFNCKILQKPMTIPWVVAASFPLKHFLRPINGGSNNDSCSRHWLPLKPATFFDHSRHSEATLLFPLRLWMLNKPPHHPANDA